MSSSPHCPSARFPIAATFAPCHRNIGSRIGRFVCARASGWQSIFTSSSEEMTHCGVSHLCLDSSACAGPLSSLISHLSSLISNLSSLISYLLSLISYLLSLISLLLSLISYLLSLISYLLSLVSYLLSLVSCLLSLITPA